MIIDDVVRVTRRIIERNGFDYFLPTACYPREALVTVLEGYPDDIVPSDVVHEWASSRAKDAPYLVAFKVDARHFQVDSVIGNAKQSAVFEV
jgi:hypothetical protein